MNLWAELNVPFEPTIPSPACGETTFSLVQNDGGVTAFQADWEENLVFGTPVDRVTEPGLYSLSIKTDFVVERTGEVQSVLSDPIRVAVTDPCPFTDILPNPLPNLKADIGYFD